MHEEKKEFKNLGEMRRFMGGSQHSVFTKSNDRIGYRELKRGSGHHSGIEGLLLDPMISGLLESMLEPVHDDTKVKIISKEINKDPIQD